MRLLKMKVQGFRCLYQPEDAAVCTTAAEASGFDGERGVTIEFDPITVLIGCNDSGKSTVLDILEIVLGGGKPDENDFYRKLPGPGKQGVSDETISPQITVTLEFTYEPERDARASSLVCGDRITVRTLYSLTSQRDSYWGESPTDSRLRQDFSKLKTDDQKDLISALDPTGLDGLTNSTQRVEWLTAYAQGAPKSRHWIDLPRGYQSLLPRFDRYSTMGYSDPAGFVLKTLQQVYESVIYEVSDEDQDNTRRLIEPLRALEVTVGRRVNDEVQTLLEYIKRYNSSVQNLSFAPTLDFARGLRTGEFLVDNGRGLTYLDKLGDGTKRRVFMAMVDWDREVSRRQAAADAGLPTIIRGYDEPDTNLDYTAQRSVYSSISDIVNGEGARVQAIICTHSPRLIDRAPARSVRLLKWRDGRSTVEMLHTRGDPDVEVFLSDMARELGLSNTLMFYERCFVLVEGETEANALPLLYRTAHGHSLLEDGIRIINVGSNGAFREFLRLMAANRQSLSLVFADLDTECSDAGRFLTKDLLAQSGFGQQFCENSVLYAPEAKVGANGDEFEAAFPDDVIAKCLNLEWPRSEDAWEPHHIADCRNTEKKFSDVLKRIVWCSSRPEGNGWSKPSFGRVLGRQCTLEQIPVCVTKLFTRAREIACND